MFALHENRNSTEGPPPIEYVLLDLLLQTVTTALGKDLVLHQSPPVSSPAQSYFKREGKYEGPGPSGLLRPYRTGAMQDPGYELPRIRLLGTWVNKECTWHVRALQAIPPGASYVLLRQPQ